MKTTRKPYTSQITLTFDDNEIDLIYEIMEVYSTNSSTIGSLDDNASGILAATICDALDKAYENQRNGKTHKSAPLMKDERKLNVHEVTHRDDRK